MNIVKKVAALVLAVLFCSSTLFAQEQEGLIQRLRKRFAPKPNTAVTAPQKSGIAGGTATPQTVAMPNMPKEETPVPQTMAGRGTPAAQTRQGPAIKNMSKEELVTSIIDDIDSESEILDYIPELKRQKDKTGKEFYTYRSGDKDVRLEELDVNVLEKLYVKAQNQATVIRTNRINEQLETIRRVQNLPKVPQQPPRVTSMVTPPPSIPSQPPSTPTQPKAPPTPPPAPPTR